MSDKIERDLAILVAMAEEMEAYLASDVLFWPLGQGGFPRLTLGGYLLRQERLLAVRSGLSAEAQVRLDGAVGLFKGALAERIVRFEQRAHEELGTRLRQWEQKLKEGFGSRAIYASGVEVRTIMEALVGQLRVAPYRLDAVMEQRLAMLDVNLRKRLQEGEFVWDEVWEVAYPAGVYWWLYGVVK